MDSKNSIFLKLPLATLLVRLIKSRQSRKLSFPILGEIVFSHTFHSNCSGYPEVSGSGYLNHLYEEHCSSRVQTV